ncbi:hypothetical protein OHO27_24010 [Streptomyces sp. NBC_00443]
MPPGRRPGLLAPADVVEGAGGVLPYGEYRGQVGGGDAGAFLRYGLREAVGLDLPPGPQLVRRGQQVAHGRAGVDQVQGQGLSGQR